MIDTPFEKVLALSRDQYLLHPPTNIELNFSIAVHENAFLDLIKEIQISGQNQYLFVVRLNRNIDIESFLEKILEV